MILLFALVAVGVTTVAGQILIPFASDLADDARLGEVVGIEVSGALTGILAARVVSGLIAGALGWRAVFGIAAVLMLVGRPARPPALRGVAALHLRAHPPRHVPADRAALRSDQLRLVLTLLDRPDFPAQRSALRLLDVRHRTLRPRRAPRRPRRAGLRAPARPRLVQPGDGAVLAARDRVLGDLRPRQAPSRGCWSGSSCSTSPSSPSASSTRPRSSPARRRPAAASTRPTSPPTSSAVRSGRSSPPRCGPTVGGTRSASSEVCCAPPRSCSG